VALLQKLQQRLKADHGALTRLINPERGFTTLPTASATIKGFEVMRTIRKRLCLMLESGTTEEVRCNRCSIRVQTAPG
jgi:hypothetical protein